MARYSYVLPVISFFFITDAVAAVKLARFISHDAPFEQQACLGYVTQHSQGIPREIANLGSIDGKFCQPLGVSVAPELINEALQRGDDLPSLSREIISESEQAERILPPIQYSKEQLVNGERLIIGVGFNYVEHLEETGDYSGTSPLLLFSKPVFPTGPYTPVKVGSSDQLLLDYEVELAMITLTDIDLSNPPTPNELYPNVAFALANDLSDRVPIITNPEFGYTQGKSEPGYLPLGPWLRLGREGFADEQGNWQIDSSISLGVTKAESGEFILEQDASLTQMRFDPYQIIQIMAKRHDAQDNICMRDADGQPHWVLPQNGIIPAGSILLTGTAGGTAIQAPSLWKKIGLFFKAGFSIDNARNVFLNEQIVDRNRLGYLQHQDMVSANIQGLGQQVFEVQVLAQDNIQNRTLPSPICQ
ncbi:fumarylacetoacetate hydrolase family protein [Neiella marina]|uniref:Fumarylacetoacetate hydrolase family protein n=1 Tax=Neiella holothuriorum TaxID=2870530 RepID=A0ABS7EDF5_9GAMM|nr:fumarylacetoacetate hydrolase family protein [Neiella holothuriorum]MBW8190351.1 fumarylacetoacetate hydrolase family protein [Neiella holothuriorum]